MNTLKILYNTISLNKINLLLSIFLIISLKSFSSGYITISSTVPNTITVCGQPKIFNITITNPSSFNLTNVTFSVNMPSGINYQIGSIVNGTVLTTSPLNAPSFSLANIPSLTSITISYTATANCDVLSHLSLGLPIENYIKVNYTAGLTTTFDTHTTSTYIVKQPNLSITTISNQTYTGTIGGTFTRCITVVNGSTGELSGFTLTDTHGSGIQVTAASPGTWLPGVGTETYVLTGADFTTIGNGNTLFEVGESITICETINILNCSSVNSNFIAGWGCNSQICQYSSSSANVVFPNTVPNLVFTPTSSENPCLGSGNVSPQSLQIKNTGLGQAVNTLVDIFNSSGTAAVWSGEWTEIDVASITVKINNGPTLPFSITSSTASAGYSCLSAGAKAGVTLTFPTINAGDSVRIRWNTKSCCSTTYIFGWGFTAKYSNICANNYVQPFTWGDVYKTLHITSLTNNGSPSTLSSGETATFNYMTTGFGFSYPFTPTSTWNVTYTLSPCYTYSPGTIKILNATSLSTWLPTSVVQVGDIVTATFSGYMFTLEQAQFLIDLTGNCSTCTSGPGVIKMGILYTPVSSCSCTIPLVTNTFPLNLVCPITCEGLNFKKYRIMRTSYGIADNDDNGVPDIAGVLDFTKIKRERAMYGDTITSSFYAKIKTSVTHPNWQFCYANSTITNGNNLTSIGGKLKIYRAGSLLTTCTINSVTAVAPTATFKYDLGSTALIASGGVSAGFVYQDDDSLIFEPQYKVTTNIGGNIFPCAVTNSFVVSDIANPVSPANIFSCNTFEGNFSIIGYYYTNWGPDTYTVSSCGQKNITQNYYLSIGPCCSNYAGGNLFPFEYRQWATIKRLKVIVPTGYKFVSANFNEIRTAGTFAGISSPSYTLAPISVATNTLIFPVGSYFAGSTPTIMPSDDGFYGTLNVVIEPSCEAEGTVTKDIGYDWLFQSSGFLPTDSASSTSYVSNQDNITYYKPDILLQSTLPNINALTNNVIWDISLSNTTNSDAYSTWIAATPISGVTINTVVDLATSATLTPVGGIYQIGLLPGTATKNYRLYGTYTSCLKDSIIIDAGWNCQGYPTSVATYPCITKKLKLTVTPLTPLLVTNVITPPTVINLCDTAEYEVIGSNIQLGSAYSLTLSVVLPLSVSIIPGTSFLAYPTSGPYINVSDPIYAGGTTYNYIISTLSPSIAALGLPGILSTNNSVKIKFKVVTSCGYISGSLASFSFFGKSGCGASTGQLVSLSSQLGITGASAPYLTDTRLRTTFISPCNNFSVLRISSKNLGALAFGNTDSIRVKLPSGVTFVSGSFAGIHNAPINPVPTIFTLTGQQYLTWKLPLGVAANDSTVFNINYVGDPNILNCNISNFEALTTTSSALLCTLTGSLCGVNVITGGDTLPVFTFKSYLTISSPSGYSVPNPPSGEIGYINFTINNTGENLNASNTTVISYYNDINLNGVYDAGDVLLTQDIQNIAIPNGGTYAYSYSLSIPSGAACHIIAVLDTALNPCSCTPSQTLLTLPLKHFAIDTTICAGQTALLGYAPITGYTYSWTPGVNLSSSSISNPIVTGVNISTSPITTTYIVTVNRNTCISKDTAIVKVNPNPTLTLTPVTNSICIGKTATITVTGSTNYTWSPSATLSSSITSSVIANPTTTTTYSVIGVDANGCRNTSTTSIVVNNLPTITSNTATICYGTTTTLTAIGATNYTWSPSATLSSSVTASVNANPTITTTYSISALDANGCLNTTTTNIVVNNLPIVTSNTATICFGNTTTLTAGGATNYTWSPSATLSSSVTASVSANPTINTNYTVTGIDANGCVNTTSTNIVVNNLPIVTSNTATICFGNTTTLTAGGATNYTWSPSATLSSSVTASVSANPTITTNYTVTGIDANGCVNTTSTNIVVNNLPIVTSNTATICFGNTTTLTAGGATNYTWSPSATLSSSVTASVSANPTITTNYTVTGIDANGCVNTTSTNIVVNNLPIVTSNTATICFGNTTTLTAGGATNYTWSPSATLSSSVTASVSANPTITTNYTVTGIDANGCVNTTSTNIIVNNLPIVTSNTATICYGNTTTLTAGGASNYTWSPSATLSSSVTTSVSANPTISSTYSIIGVDANGCINTTTTNIVVNNLPIVTSNTATICFGNTTTLTATGATNYTWSPSATLSSSVTASVSANPTITTNYTITGIDANGCVNTTSTNIIVNNLPIVISNTATICFGNTTTLTAGGATNYTWSPSATLSSSVTASVSANPTITTNYTVTGIDANGCINTTSTNIIVNNLPIVTSNTATICYGNTTTLTAGGATNYTWSPSATLSSSVTASVSANPTISSTYSIIGVDANGCINTTSTNIVVNNLPTVTSTSATICYGNSGTLTASGALTYTWSPNTALSSSVSANVTANPTLTTIYNVIGTDANGCTNTSTSTVNVIPEPSVLASASPTSICSGYSTTLTATGATTYTWLPGGLTTGIVSVSPGITTTYSVTGSNTTGTTTCYTTKTVIVKVIPSTTVNIIGLDSVCIGSAVSIYANAGNTYSWEPSASINYPNSNMITVSPSVTTVYSVTASNGGICPGTATFQIVVNPLPYVYAGLDTTINNDQSYVLNGIGDVAVGFLPQNGIPLICNFCPTVEVNPTETTCYTLKGENSHHCVAYDEVCINVTKDWEVFIPNTFTPNEDSNNDIFLPIGYGIKDIKLTIYDRWGVQIFKSDDTTKGWNGKYKDVPCQQGVYVFMVEITALSGVEVTKTGHVTLLPKLK